MPPIFKALASITVWVLFVFGWLFLVVGNIGVILAGELMGAEPPSFQFYASNAVGFSFFILSLVAMKLRKTLE